VCVCVCVCVCVAEATSCSELGGPAAEPSLQSCFALESDETREQKFDERGAPRIRARIVQVDALSNLSPTLRCVFSATKRQHQKPHYAHTQQRKIISHVYLSRVFFFESAPKLQGRCGNRQGSGAASRSGRGRVELHSRARRVRMQSGDGGEAVPTTVPATIPWRFARWQMS
jgi:hypothetical protein